MRADWRSSIAAFALIGSLCGCNNIIGPSAIDSDWHVIETAHFTFHVRPGSFSEQNIGMIGEVLEDQYAYTLRALDAHYAGRIAMFLYNSGADAGLQSDHAGTAYPDTEAVRAVSIPPLGPNLYNLLGHELNHVIQDNAIGTPATYFLTEGLPSAVTSERYHSFGSTFLYSWTAANLSQIPALTILVDDAKWHDYDQQLVYNASASFLSYLLEIEGPQKVKQLQPVKSSAFENRFREIYGRSLTEAEAAWRAFCVSRSH